ncbi:hypothetical protein [Methanococcus maripaludis]|uniref:DNA polymerase II small subunit/DNA polymerase delta subunit B n=1 Tax=Methanococcus maripaludis TaxID=39152 RepID=A0A7J9PNT6_METMI|nr:hypothetical protein [Methanococcus maripaludis]MBA2864912.1 DNA polymerase II small subunit/DNA polymerase delta subunit B [Methanococcus maripaludis]
MEKKLHSKNIFGDEEFREVMERVSLECKIDINKSFKIKFKNFIDTWSEIIEDIKNTPEGIDHYNTHEFRHNRDLITYYLMESNLSENEKSEYYCELNNINAKLNYAVSKAQSRYRKEKFKEYSRLPGKFLDFGLELLKKIRWP